MKAGMPSKSEARRLILQKAVEIDSEVKNDPNEILSLRGGEILKIGKKKFFRIKI
ncbi:MAG: Tyrosine--tRNA ligase [candidate division WS2 bacterium]|nr:Tyrosine--tRNA ligase [Candidatus Lithacetigena glycinireducens]